MKTFYLVRQRNITETVEVKANSLAQAIAYASAGAGNLYDESEQWATDFVETTKPVDWPNERK